MRKLKRLLSFLLAFLFAYNMPEVYHATSLSPTLLADTNRTLAVSTQSTPVPVVDTLNISDEGVFLSWSGIAERTTSTYVLSFPLRDGRWGEFTFDKQRNIAVVKYRIYQWVNGVKQEISDSNEVNDSGVVYNVYYPQAGRYISYSDFIVNWPIDSHENYHVKDQPAPEFVIEPNTGFSIQYSDWDIHFLWDGTTDSVFYSMNGIRRGYIYPFTLTNNFGASPSTVNIFNGVNMNTLSAVPTANNGKTVMDVLVQHGATPVDTDPGSEPVGLNIIFDTPYVWDNANHIFKSVEYGNISQPIKAIIELKTDKGDTLNNMQITVEDVSVNNPSASLAPASKGSIKSITKSGGQITIELTNLEPGLLFDSSTISMSSPSLVTRGPTLASDTLFFTFPAYRVVTQGERFYIEIKTYLGYWGFYKLLASSDPPVWPPDPKRVPEDSASASSLATDEYVYLPVNINPDNPTRMYYQVFFSPLRTTIDNFSFLYSQILDYIAELGQVGISAPKSFTVTGTPKMTPTLPWTETFDTAELDISFRWDLGSTRAITQLLEKAVSEGRESLAIEYALVQGDTPNTESLTDLSKIEVSINYSDPNNPSDSLTAEYRLVDGSGTVLSTGQILLENVVSRYYAKIDMKYTAARIGSGQTGELSYPNIYFAAVYPVSYNDIPIGDRLFSPRESFTLDYFSFFEVPPPQNLELYGEPQTITDDPVLPDEVSFTVTWDISSVKLRDYLDSLSNLPRDKAQFYMNMYISSNEMYMRDDFYELDYNERRDNSVIFDSGQSDYTYDIYNPLVLYMSGENSLQPVDGHNPLDVLRGNTSFLNPDNSRCTTVMIEGLPVTADEVYNFLYGGGSFLKRMYKLDGLDKNQKYYVYVDFVVEHYYSDDTPATEPRGSITSNLIGVTTKGDREVPTGEEKIPSAPKLAIDETGATINWKKLYPTAMDEVLEYQIIRITSNQMDSFYLDTNEIYDNYWHNYLSMYTKSGLETRYPNVLRIYNGTEFVELSDNTQYEYDAFNDTIRLTDKTLTPNTMYFYYVRTVKTVNNVETYSSWAHISVTSEPVERPINLRIEVNRDDYDPRTEIVISFEAPILAKENLGTIYNLQYQLKPEGMDWGELVTMEPEILLQSMTLTSIDGLFHFEYKIKGLSHSTSYMIRVRMIDENDEGSLYSNIEQFRTQFDQPDYDIEQNFNDWIYYLREQLSKLLLDTSWITSDSANVLETVIRPGTWNDLAAGSPDLAVLLPKSDAQFVSYLIPSSVLDIANSANRGFRIMSGNNEIIIAPNSFDQNQNQAVADVLGMIRQNEIVDYMLRITVSNYDSGELINGDNSLSKIISVDFSLVGSKTIVSDWDRQVLNQFQAYIDEFINAPTIRDDFRARILNSDNESLVRHVDNLVLQAKSNFLERVASGYANLLSASFTVNSLQRPFSIVARGIDSSNSVRAYQRQANQWIGIDHSPYGSDYVIYTSAPGTYVFAGGKLDIPGLVDMPGAGVLTGIINKYALDDYLGKGGFDLNQNASRLMIVGSVARIMGAPKESDPYNWLSGNKNITLSQRNMNTEITAQEAAYLAAALYEAKSGIRIDSIQIRNYNLTSSMTGLDERYRIYVRAAGELGLVDLNSFDPGAAITIKDALQMIDAVDVMLKL